MEHDKLESTRAIIIVKELIAGMKQHLKPNEKSARIPEVIDAFNHDIKLLERLISES